MNPKPKLVSDLDFVAIEAGQEWKAKQKEKPIPRVNGSPSRTSNLDNTPRIVSVTAKGNSSFAISSTGHVYAWGCNDVGNLGLPKPDPSTLTYSDPGQIGVKASSIQRQFQTYSFDSLHNIALPQRLDSLRDFHIKSVSASSTFMWCLGTKRHGQRDRIGRTLYEVKEAKRQKSPRPQPESKWPTSLTSEESNSGREKHMQYEQQTITSSEISNSSETGVTGWTRAKNAPALPTDTGRSKADSSASSSKEFSRLHDSISTDTPKSIPSNIFRNEQEESSQTFPTSAIADKRPSGSSPGKKKRLFSPKKLVQAIVRRASSTTNSFKTEPASLPTVDVVGSDKNSPENK